MRLKKLALRQFRNITHIEFEPHEILNYIVGENAQGKTSLIESVFFLSTLRSFRASRVNDLIQFGTEAAQVEGIVSSRWDPDSNVRLKVRLEPGRRRTTINDKVVSSSKFITQLRSVVFSPESLAAIKAGPDLRRELIDLATFQISNTAAQTQRDFSKALRQRNALLKQIKEGVMPVAKGRPVIESLDEVYLHVATDLVADRLEFLDSILPGFREVLSAILGRQVALEVLYQSGDRPWNERGQPAIEQRLRTELTDSTRRVAEEALGLTLTGPHRHDLSFVFDGNDSRIFCSQGQQRALILAFKIAEIMYHSKVFNSYPLLLLDDVLSEFDEKKRRFLIEFLRTNEAQTFLTATDYSQVLQGCSVFRIEAGGLRIER